MNNLIRSAQLNAEEFEVLNSRVDLYSQDIDEPINKTIYNPSFSPGALVPYPRTDMADLIDLQAGSNSPVLQSENSTAERRQAENLPYIRLSANNTMIPFSDNTFGIPSNICLFSFSEVYKVIGAKFRVPKIVNYQSTVLQLIKGNPEGTIYLDNQVSAPFNFSYLVYTRGVTIVDFNDNPFLRPGFQGNYSGRNDLLEGGVGKFQIPDIDHKLNPEDLKYFVNILESNRQRIDTWYQQRHPVRCAELMAYDIIFQQLVLILTLATRGLIKSGDRPSLEQIYRLFISRLNEQNFIHVPCTLFMTIRQIRQTWNTYLKDPATIDLKEKYKLELYGKIQYSSAIVNDYYTLRITEKILVPEPSKIYDKHPTDIPNVLEEEDELVYEFKLRSPIRELEYWNVKLEYPAGLDWFLYLDHYDWQSPQEDYTLLGQFKTIEQAYKYLVSEDYNVITLQEILELKSNPLRIDNSESERHSIWLYRGPRGRKIKQVLMPIEDERELQVVELKHKYIRINGISFDSQCLQLLYNTWLFETLVRTGESEIELPHFTTKDIKLLRDVLKGRVSLIYFYSEISEYTYAQLSGDRTMMDLFDMLYVRRYIDLYFSIGESLRHNIAKIRLPNDEERIPRLAELVQISQR